MDFPKTVKWYFSNHERELIEMADPQIYVEPEEHVRIRLKKQHPSGEFYSVDWGPVRLFRADPVGWITGLNRKGQRLYLASSEVLDITVLPVVQEESMVEKFARYKKG